MLNKPLPEWTACDFLRKAYINARDFSDDPSTQNGSVLVPAGYPLNRVFFGANRFPSGIKVTPERLADRDTKLAFMQHAERDAIFKAARNGISTDGATLYCPWYACIECAKAIIGAGITRVVGHLQAIQKTPDRWKENIQVAEKMLDEAGVERTYLVSDLFGSDPDYQVLFNGEYWIP
jgi:dCMP deaminase